MLDDEELVTRRALKSAPGENEDDGKELVLVAVTAVVMPCLSLS